MLPDPRPNLELGLAAFSLLPVLFSPLFAENRPELWHRPPSVLPKIKASYWLKLTGPVVCYRARGRDAIVCAH
jgi:hypothetical protein